jgi:hypothetical protein
MTVLQSVMLYLKLHINLACVGNNLKSRAVDLINFLPAEVTGLCSIHSDVDWLHSKPSVIRIKSE